MILSHRRNLSLDTGGVVPQSECGFYIAYFTPYWRQLSYCEGTRLLRADAEEQACRHKVLVAELVLEQLSENEDVA